MEIPYNDNRLYTPGFNSKWSNYTNRNMKTGSVVEIYTWVEKNPTNVPSNQIEVD